MVLRRLLSLFMGLGSNKLIFNSLTSLIINFIMKRGYLIIGLVMSSIRPNSEMPSNTSTSQENLSAGHKLSSEELDRVVFDRFNQQEEVPTSRTETPIADEHSFQMDSAVENPRQAKTTFKIKDLVKESYVWPLIKAGGSMIRQEPAQAMNDLREGLRSIRDDAKVFYNAAQKITKKKGSKTEVSEESQPTDDPSQTSLKTSGSLEYMSHYYKGKLVKGVPEGIGILKYPSSSKYIGEFKDGVPEGFGILTTEKREVIRGEFKNGRANGPGVLKDRDQTLYRGNFVKGRLEGEVEITYPSGTQSVANFRAGQRVFDE